MKKNNLMSILKMTIVLMSFLCIRCVYFTIGRHDNIYPHKIEHQPNQHHFIFDLKFEHSMWTDAYCASDTVSDSILLIHNLRQRDSALKALKYWSLGRMIACGWKPIDYLSISDSSKFNIVGINYEGVRYGHLGFEIVCKDTGHSDMVICSNDEIIRTGFTIKPDTLIFDEYSRHSFDRSRWFLPFLWIAQLWPFWPAF
jgi:hypothetical protein